MQVRECYKLNFNWFSIMRVCGCVCVRDGGYGSFEQEILEWALENEILSFCKASSKNVSERHNIK